MRNQVKIYKGSYKGQFEAPTEFKDWRVLINQKSKMVLIRFTNGDYNWHTTPYNPELKVMINFKNPDEWKLFEDSCKMALETQEKLFPDKFLQQKEEAEKELEYIMSMV